MMMLTDDELALLKLCGLDADNMEPIGDCSVPKAFRCRSFFNDRCFIVHPRRFHRQPTIVDEDPGGRRFVFHHSGEPYEQKRFIERLINCAGPLESERPGCCTDDYFWHVCTPTRTSVVYDRDNAEMYGISVGDYDRITQSFDTFRNELIDKCVNSENSRVYGPKRIVFDGISIGLTSMQANALYFEKGDGEVTTLLYNDYKQAALHRIHRKVVHGDVTGEENKK